MGASGTACAADAMATAKATAINLIIASLRSIGSKRNASANQVSSYFA
jgi:hypothetical protein